MESTVTSGIFLMTVGMTTVFSILLIVIFSGSALIRIVNKYSTIQNAKDFSNSNVGKVIRAAIKEITNGTGVVKKIKKL